MADNKDIKNKIAWTCAIWVICLLLIIICGLVSVLVCDKVYDSYTVMKYLSAFATVLSIILSIIAIAVTFHSSYETSRKVDDISGFNNEMLKGFVTNNFSNTQFPPTKADPGVEPGTGAKK